MDFLQRQKKIFTADELEKIKDMVVFIGGSGGLGTHQAMELQRIGVKKIYLMDSDQIEPSNLNRQVLYGKKDIGQKKALTAKKKLDSFQLGTEVVAITGRIEEDTEIPDDVQIIFDAVDNIGSRFVLEKLAVKYNLPLIHGGIHSLSGQVTTIIPGETMGLKEVFGANPKDPESIYSFSPVVAIIASLQVVEGVKVILGRPELANKLLMMDLEDCSFHLLDFEETI